MCALRNLNGFPFGKRDLKVSYATDDKHGSNLKEEHMMGRDGGDVIPRRAIEKIGSEGVGVKDSLHGPSRESILASMKHKGV